MPDLYENPNLPPRHTLVRNTFTAQIYPYCDPYVYDAVYICTDLTRTHRPVVEHGSQRLVHMSFLQHKDVEELIRLLLAARRVMKTLWRAAIDDLQQQEEERDAERAAEVDRSVQEWQAQREAEVAPSPKREALPEDFDDDDIPY